jgi:hypothetical protein
MMSYYRRLAYGSTLTTYVPQAGSVEDDKPRMGPPIGVDGKTFAHTAS